MALNCKHNHPLQHNGTSQDKRFLEALEPGFARVHEFSLKDWMQFAWHFARHLNYFSVSDDVNPDGNWQAFFKAEDELETYLRDAALVSDETWIPSGERQKIENREPRGNYEPHLALFLSFLKLTKFAQSHLNGLTERHLDFYYTQVLRLSRRPAVPDRVHLLFELARNAGEELVKISSLLEAGKDKTGKPLRYATSEEMTVNTARVSLLKSVFHQKGRMVRYAEMTNSSDGLGTEFKEENPDWQAFGNESWPAATLGFGLASAVLLLKEGVRLIHVSLELKVKDASDLPDKETVRKQIKVFVTGEKDWMHLPDVTVSQVPASAKAKLEFTVLADESQKAIVPYDIKVHGERFNTNLPVMRVLFNTQEENGYYVYSAFSNAVITGATITVDVKGVKDLSVENDHGRLDPSRPFYPFGPLPKKGSGFYIGSSEIFQKKWKNIKLNINWKDKPGLAQQYIAYRSQFITGNSSNYNLQTTGALDGSAIVTGDSYFTVFPQYIKGNRWYPESAPPDLPGLFDSPLEIDRDAADPGVASLPAVPPLLMRKGIDVNKATLRNYLLPQAKPDDSKASRKKVSISSRFESARFNPGFRTLAVITENFNPATRSDYLKLTLQQDFLHSHYPRLLTLAMVAKTAPPSGNPNILMPQEPYTPVIASMTIDYQASAKNVFVFDKSASPKSRYDNFVSRSIQLFHEHPFGQAEQHVFLKEQCDFIDPNERRNIRLLPAYSPEGELYIGLQGAQPSGIVNLLVQSVEGSENPLAPTFTGEKKIEWFALSNNEWKPLNRDFITGDSTNHFLRPGIVKISLPAMVNESNTILDSGHIWLKAQLPEGLDHTSVCRLAGVFAQAVEARFSDNGNDLSHLRASLPAFTISKFVEKPALVKSVTQPYGSFGGAPEENDRDFYQRVSERLRHKQRAVSIWDYERLVLQQFPSVYKVKCLSHTSTRNEAGSPDYFELSPGFVTLIVIPDIRNRNSFDPLQPRASQNLLREIEDFLDPLNSLHVRFDADNPDYETVFLDFRVKFYDQYDANAYRNILNEDIVRYLSPWAFGEFSDIRFGGTLYKSVIIRFIEERSYVDFISDFKMYQRIGEGDQNVVDRNQITATNARAILVSARGHNIGLIEKDEVCHE